MTKKPKYTPPQNSVKAVYDVKKKVAVATSDAIDRYGEIIDQNGLDVAEYQANPVMLWAHDHTQPAIGNAENLQLVQMGGGKKAWTFTPNFHGQTELSAAMDVLYNGDPDNGINPVLNSFSIGYQVLEEDGNVCTKSTLLEISSCNVPANPDARVLAYKSLVGKGIDQKLAKSIVGSDAKGAVQDELDLEAIWQQKADNMKPVRDIYWAFCDVYFDEDSGADDFGSLLLEVANLFTQVANGTYIDPVQDDDDDVVELSHKVLDKVAQKPNDRGNKAKTKPVAPIAPDQKIRSRQSLIKVIAKASDQLLADEKSGSRKDDRVKMVKVIKKSAEILSKSHKEEINHG